MRDYHINIFYSEEDGGYIADIPDLRNCSTFASHRKKRWLRWKRPNKPGWGQPVMLGILFLNRATALPSTRRNLPYCLCAKPMDCDTCLDSESASGLGQGRCLHVVRVFTSTPFQKQVARFTAI
jgi:hypothetical protein